MKLYRKFLFFVFIYLIEGNDLKIGGPLLVHGWSCNWFNSCCSGSSSDSDKSEKTTNPSEKTAIVDIKKPLDVGYQSTNDGYIFTYTPRSDYSFNAVKEDSKEIWKADKKEEYSKKVVADFAKKVVTIYIGSGEGSTKVFTKGSDGTWKEDTNKSTHKTTTDGSGGGATPSSQPSSGTTGTGASGGGSTPGSTPAS